MALTPEQVATFHERGYVVVADVFDQQVLGDLERELDDFVSEQAALAIAAGELTQDYAELPFDQRLGAITAETRAVALALHGKGRLHGPAIFAFMTHPRLLDTIESLTGPEIVASSVYRIRAKVPGSLGEVAWHQDSGFFEPYCDDGLIVTVWAPLVNATRENGCLWFWPGEHKRGLKRHVPSDKAGLSLAAEMLPQEGAVPVPVPRGGAVLFTNMTPHASFTNSTDRVRWSLDLRYQSAALPTNAPIPRLPGEAVADVDDGVPLACYPPEADFLVRSALRPESVVADHHEFKRLREEHVVAPVSRRWVSDDGSEEFPPAEWYSRPAPTA